MALSVGVTLLWAGLLTHVAVAEEILGAIVMAFAAVGLVSEVLPHSSARPCSETGAAAGRRGPAAAWRVSQFGEHAHRARLPIKESIPCQPA